VLKILRPVAFETETEARPETFETETRDPITDRMPL